MKKLLGIVVLSLLWCNVGYSKDCSHIDYKKSKNEFLQCLKTVYQKENKGLFNKSKNFIKSLFEDDEDKVSPRAVDPATNLTNDIDFECLNICKDSVKGMTITELNLFCKLQCRK